MRKKQVKPVKISQRYRRYSAESLVKAYNAVRTKGWSVAKASNKFGVPCQTLRDRVRGQIDPHNFSSGADTTMTREEESTLVEHIGVMASLGYGYTNFRSKHLAGELAFDLGREKSNKPMSNNWLYGFLKRWSDRLKSLSPRKLDSTRAKAATPEIVETYFNNLEEITKKYDLTEKPQFIYNLDETGLQPEHRPPNVIANPDSKPQAITSPRSTTTTLIGCVNALGNSVPPFFVFKGKQYYPDLIKGASAGARGVMSDSGWSNSAIFREYLEHHFLPFVRPGTDESQPILLIYDGHASHKTPELIKWAKEHNLILFVLPAHTSHLLQPLDVGLFCPFKNYYYPECSSYLYKHMGQVITRYEICAIACKAYLKAMSPINITGGFKKTRIYPFCKDKISPEKLIPCESFREEKPTEKAKAVLGGKEAVEKFLTAKMEQLENVQGKECSCGKKTTSSRPNASGKAITEDEYFDDMTQYEMNKEQPKGNKRPRKSQTERKGKAKRSDTSSAEKENIPSSPLPSTSGVNVRRCLSTALDVPSDTDSYVDTELSESELCCVCHKYSPANLSKFPTIKIVTWGQCDRCSHWVHLAFCTPVRVVRRLGSFFCPHCTQ